MSTSKHVSTATFTKGDEGGPPVSAGRAGEVADRVGLLTWPPGFENVQTAKPMSAEQLIAEVKGIYAGLILVERKCLDVVYLRYGAPMLNHKNLHALTGLHPTLHHEHHDFFLSSQHPSAGPSLKRLPQEYTMPARMWYLGVHHFLVMLCYQLPSSQEHLLYFIPLAYSMMALLYETVPAFQDIWIECLGHLACYRMAMEDDKNDWEVWLNIAMFWYRHLPNFTSLNILQELCSRGVTRPFSSGRVLVVTVFDPIPDVFSSRSQPVGQPRTIVFHIKFEKFDAAMDGVLGLAENTRGPQSKWKVRAFNVHNITDLYQYGSGVSRSVIVKGPEVLDPEITAFDGDTNLITQTLNLDTRERWTVIIPTSVITEPSCHGTNSAIQGSAESAMIATNKAIADKVNFWIITARGTSSKRGPVVKLGVIEWRQSLRKFL